MSPAVAQRSDALQMPRIAALSKGAMEFSLSGRGPAVLAIHGSPGGFDHAELFFGNLAGQGFTLIAPSRPGFLRTSLELGRTVAEQADLMVELLDKLGVHDFFLCGFSCGAATAVRIAARYPERVRGMILESPVTKSFKHKCTDGLHGKLLLSDFGSFVMRQLIDHAPLYSIERLLERQGDYDRLGIRQEARRIFWDNEKRWYALRVLEQCLPASDRAAGMINDARQLEDFENRDLFGVKCPTLIIHGAADGEVSLRHGEHAAERIANSRLMIVPDACHLLCLSPRWRDIQEARLAFLKAVLSGSRDPLRQVPGV